MIQKSLLGQYDHAPVKKDSYAEEYNDLTKVFEKLYNAKREFNSESPIEASNELLSLLNTAESCLQRCVDRLGLNTQVIYVLLIKLWILSDKNGELLGIGVGDKLLEFIKYGNQLKKYIKNINNLYRDLKKIGNPNICSQVLGDKTEKIAVLLSKVDAVLPYAEKINYFNQASKYYLQCRYLTHEDAIISPQLAEDIYQKTWSLWRELWCNLVDPDVASMFLVTAQKILGKIVKERLLPQVDPFQLSLISKLIENIIISAEAENKDYFRNVSPYIFARMRELETTVPKDEKDRKRIISSYEGIRSKLDFENYTILFESYYPQEALAIETKLRDLVVGYGFDYFRQDHREKMLEMVCKFTDIYNKAFIELNSEDSRGYTALTKPFCFNSTRFISCIDGTMETFDQLFLVVLESFNAKCKAITSSRVDNKVKISNFNKYSKECTELLEKLKHELKELQNIKSVALKTVLLHNPLSLGALLDKSINPIIAGLKKAFMELDIQQDIFDGNIILNPIPEIVVDKMLEDSTTERTNKFRTYEERLRKEYEATLKDLGGKIKEEKQKSTSEVNQFKEVELEKMVSAKYRGKKKPNRAKKSYDKKNQKIAKEVNEEEVEYNQSISPKSPEENMFIEAQKLREQKNIKAYKSKLNDVQKLATTNGNYFVLIGTLHAKIACAFSEIERLKSIVVTYDQLQDNDFREKHMLQIQKGLDAIDWIKHYSVKISEDLKLMLNTFDLLGQNVAASQVGELEAILEQIAEYQSKSDNLKMYLDGERQAQENGQKEFFSLHPELKKNGNLNSVFSIRRKILNESILATNCLTASLNNTRERLTDSFSMQRESFVLTQQPVSKQNDEICNYIKGFLKELFSSGSTIANLVAITCLYNQSRPDSDHIIKADLPIRSKLETHKVCDKDGKIKDCVIQYLQKHLTRVEADGLSYKYDGKELRGR